MASSNTLKMWGIGFAAFAVSAVFVTPAAAQGPSRRILARYATTIEYSSKPDVVTVFASEMARYRRELTDRGDGASLASVLAPTRLNDEFREWTWRSLDGSLLQSFAGRDLQLTKGNCLSRLCSAIECSSAGWPAFQCSDGRRREMLVTDFKTMVFGNISYGRLSEPALAGDKSTDARDDADAVIQSGG
jgi:hypothetical protein